ncbi:hypothetical protein M9H77_36827 [Catharanthus roseus]|uniref:Uncharacterized protein n=1 Tax=Catharanthus roseus TaxID=4058 RepID=A0ACB9ZX60_CATRO|nr:hypothetical protein M9H77_36827 [Catharanthus roseus]
MVGLSVVLEGQKELPKKSPQVIRKATINMIKSPSPVSSSSSSSSSSSNNNNNNPFSRRNYFSTDFKGGFLDFCFLCKQKLLPGKDIYMYKGDRAFCSEDCRYRQIFMDEEETTTITTSTVKPKTTHYCSSMASSSKKARNPPNNGFAC